MKRILTIVSALTVITVVGGLATARGAKRPSYADVEVGEMELMDPVTTTYWLGGPVPFQYRDVRPTARYTNADGTELLTVASHHGNVRDSVSEIDVQPVEGRCGPCQTVEVEQFVSGRGVRLGMTKDEVIGALGKAGSETSADGLIQLEYRIRKPKAPEFLEEYNVPGYYGVYTFRDGVLVQYAFGFELP